MTIPLMKSDLYVNDSSLSVELTPQGSDTVYFGTFSDPGDDRSKISIFRK